MSNIFFYMFSLFYALTGSASETSHSKNTTQQTEKVVTLNTIKLSKFNINHMQYIQH